MEKIQIIYVLVGIVNLVFSYTEPKFDLFNGVLTVYNMKLSEHDFQFDNSTVCKCKMACTVSNNCNTASFEHRNDGIHRCRLSSKIIHETELKKNEGSYSFAKGSPFKYYFGQDGVFYGTTPQMNEGDDIKKADQTCGNEYESGEVLMLKSAGEVRIYRDVILTEYQDLVESGTFSALLGLERKNIGDELKWVDNSEFDSTILGPLVEDFVDDNKDIMLFEIVYENETFTIQEDSTSVVVCQMRPLDV